MSCTPRRIRRDGRLRHGESSEIRADRIGPTQPSVIGRLADCRLAGWAVWSPKVDKSEVCHLWSVVRAKPQLIIVIAAMQQTMQLRGLQCAPNCSDEKGPVQNGSTCNELSYADLFPCEKKKNWECRDTSTVLALPPYSMPTSSYSIPLRYAL